MIWPRADTLLYNIQQHDRAGVAQSEAYVHAVPISSQLTCLRLPRQGHCELAAKISL